MTTPDMKTYAVRLGRRFGAVHVHPSGQCYADTDARERVRSRAFQLFVEGTDAIASRELAMLPTVRRYGSAAELRRSVIAAVGVYIGRANE